MAKARKARSIVGSATDLLAVAVLNRRVVLLDEDTLDELNSLRCDGKINHQQVDGSLTHQRGFSNTTTAKHYNLVIAHFVDLQKGI